MKKERKVPAGLTESESNEYGVVFYSTNAKMAMGFTGNKSKHSFYYRFQSAEKMAENTKEFLAKVKADGEQAKLKKEKNDSYDANQSFKVGDVVYNTWGYEQTVQTPFKVMSVTKKFLTLMEIDSVITENGFMSGHSMPVPEKEIGKPEKHSVYLCGEEPWVRFKHGSGQKWDGKPQSCSWYA